MFQKTLVLYFGVPRVPLISKKEIYFFRKNFGREALFKSLFFFFFIKLPAAVAPAFFIRRRLFYGDGLRRREAFRSIISRVTTISLTFFSDGQVIHRFEQDLFEDHHQAAGADLAFVGLVGDRREGTVGEFEPDIIELKLFLILLDERVFGLGQDRDQGGLVQLAKLPMTGRRPTNSGIRP